MRCAPLGRAACRACGLSVVWVFDEGGRPLALDPVPTPCGTVIRDATYGRCDRVRRLRPGEGPMGRLLYVGHRGTCRPA